MFKNFQDALTVAMGGRSVRQAARLARVPHGTLERYLKGVSIPKDAKRAYNVSMSLTDTDAEGLAMMRLWAEERIRRVAPGALEWLWRLQFPARAAGSGGAFEKDSDWAALHDMLAQLTPAERWELHRILTGVPLMNSDQRSWWWSQFADFGRRANRRAFGVQVFNAEPSEAARRDRDRWKAAADNFRRRAESLRVDLEEARDRIERYEAVLERHGIGNRM